MREFVWKMLPIMYGTVFSCLILAAVIPLSPPAVLFTAIAIVLLILTTTAKAPVST